MFIATSLLMFHHNLFLLHHFIDVSSLYLIALTIYSFNFYLTFRLNTSRNSQIDLFTCLLICVCVSKRIFDVNRSTKRTHHLCFHFHMKMEAKIAVSFRRTVCSKCKSFKILNVINETFDEKIP